MLHNNAIKYQVFWDKIGHNKINKILLPFLNLVLLLL